MRLDPQGPEFKGKIYMFFWSIKEPLKDPMERDEVKQIGKFLYSLQQLALCLENIGIQ